MVLEHFSEKASALITPVNIGIVSISREEFIAIDTGIDNSALNKVIKQTGKKPRIVLITHHHSDHMGGARKYCGKLSVFCPQGELGLIRNPIMEPSMFFGGVPPNALRNKYLMAKPCSEAIPFNSHLLNDFGITLIPTPGHSTDLHSVMVEDVIFASDSFLPAEIIERHSLLFLTNPKQALASMERILGHNPSVIIPGHGTPIEDKKVMKETIAITEEHIQHVKTTLVEVIGERNTLESTVKESLKRILGETTLDEFPLWRYFLNRHVIFNYISELEREKLITLELDDQIIWLRLE